MNFMYFPNFIDELIIKFLGVHYFFVGIGKHFDYNKKLALFEFIKPIQIYKRVKTLRKNTNLLFRKILSLPQF